MFRTAAKKPLQASRLGTPVFVPRFVVRATGGFKFVLEPLWMTLGAVDDKFDPGQQWKDAARYVDCLQPVTFGENQ